VEIVIVISVVLFRWNQDGDFKGSEMQKTMNKNGAKTQFDQYQKALEAKAED